MQNEKKKLFFDYMGNDLSERSVQKRENKSKAHEKESNCEAITLKALHSASWRLVLPCHLLDD